jgi:hypothetical protein
MGKGTMIHGVDISHQQVDMADQADGAGQMAGAAPQAPRTQEMGPRNPKGLGRSLVKKAQYAEKAKLKAKLKA